MIHLINLILISTLSMAAIDKQSAAISKLKAHEDKIQRLEEEKLFLEGLLSRKQKKKVVLSKSASHKVKVKSDSKLYLSLLDHFQQGRYDEFIAEYEIFKRSYKSSIYIDRILYLISNMDYSLGRFTQSLSAASEIIDKYPLSPRRPAALYTKAQIYNQLKLQDQVKITLKAITREYPGSVEAKRAKYELNFLNSQKSKK